MSAVESADEPLLVEEASRYINKIAKQQGFAEHRLMHVSAKFDWNELINAQQSLSLFSEKKIIELYLPTGKPGTAGSANLLEYANALAAETLLIIRLPKLPISSQKSKWFTALEKSGIAINIQNITAEQLPHWITRRLARVKLSTSNQGINTLTNLSEGNLLAAKQNIEKLSLRYGEGELNIEQIDACLSDHAHYDVYALLHSTLNLELDRSLKILQNLKATGIAATLILWVLSKEIRTLARLARAVEQGSTLNSLWQPYGIWTQRQAPLKKHLTMMNYQQYLQLLHIAAHCDQCIKGIVAGDVWQCLQQLVLQMCKAEVLAA